MPDKNDTVIITLDRPRALRFGHKALKTLTAMTGKSIESLGNIGDFDFEDIEKIMYCGLLSDARQNNEDLKLEDMEELLDRVQFKEITNKMTEALIASFGEDEDLGKNAQRTAPKKKK